MGEWITKTLEGLQNNPYIWLVIAVCTFIGLPAFFYSIHSQRKNNKRKVLSYRKNSKIIISKKARSFEDLKILYKEQEVGDLSVTEYIIWNSGNKAIKSEDIVSDRPLRIKALSQSKILSAEIINENEKTNHFSLFDMDSKAVSIRFEYVDSNEGIVVRIIHTGNPLDLDLDCKIMEGDELKQEKEWFMDKGLSLLIPIRSYKIKHFFLGVIITFLSIIFVLDILVIAGVAHFENHQLTDSNLIEFWIMLAIIGGALFCYTKALVSSIKTVILKKRLFQNN